MRIEEINHLYDVINVLHVDDDEYQLFFFKKFMEGLKENIKIESINDPVKAIEKIREKKFDCIVSDFVMPRLNGIEMVKEIKKFSNVPIILYTGQGNEDVAGLAISSGVDDYLKKGIDLGDYQVLLNKIETAIEKNRTEIMYSKLVKSIDDCLVIVDDKNEIIYHNENLQNLVKNDNLLHSKIVNLIEDHSRNKFNMWLKDEKSRNIDTVLVDFEGNSFFIEAKKYDFDEFEDKHKLLVIKDVTKLTINERISASNEEKYFSLVEEFPDGIITGNLMGYVTYVNPAFCRLTGFSKDEIIGRHALRLQTVISKDIKGYWNLVKQLLTGGKEKIYFEFPYDRKDGSVGIGETYVNVIHYKGKRELIGICRDITKRKIQEEEYENIFKLSPEGIIVLDMEGNFKSLNESAYSVLEKELDYYAGKNIYDLQNIGDELSVLINMFERIISKEKTETLTIKKSIDEKIRWIEFCISLIKVYDERLGVQIIIRDITKQKENEIIREKYTTNLEELIEERTRQIIDNEKMVAIGKMSSMIVHDLRGPLQVISNSLYMMKTHPEKQEIFTGYISEAINRCNDMLNELSTSTKKTPLNLEKTSVEDIINDASLQLELVENVKYDKIIETQTELYLDKLKFRRIFDNLFKNAVEAMPAGGKITVSVKEDQNDVIIKVMDTGTGIQKERLSSLFVPFQSTKSRGMGLGLAFCKNAVESHGGEISVESDLGKGTTFTISIPKVCDISEKYHPEGEIDKKITLK